jgi:hypothetical protein
MLQRKLILAFVGAKSLRTISKSMLSKILSGAPDNCFGTVTLITPMNL